MTRFTAHLAVALAAAMLVGCGSSATVPATAPPSASSAPPASFPVDPFAAPDEALVAQLMETEGLEESEAVFVALTKVDMLKIGPLTYLITQWYPTGNSSEITVTLTPDVTADPAAPEPLMASYTETDGGLGIRLEYFVAYDAMPDDVEQQIKAAAAATGSRAVPLEGLLALAGPVLAGQFLAGEQKSGVQVVAEAVIKKMARDRVSDFVKAMDARMGTGSTQSDYLKTLRAGLTAADALAMGDEHDAYMKRLGEFENCVRNPTNPITRETYRTHPEQQQQALNAIAGVRSEIKANIAVIYLGMMTSTASGSNYATEFVPWVGWLAGPATKWSKETLRQMNDALMDEVQKLVTPCEEEWDFVMTMGYGSGNERLGVVWTGTFQIAAPLTGQPQTAERPITGAGTVSGEFHTSKCSIPTNLSGGTQVKTGDFAYSATAEFVMQGNGAVEVTNHGPVLFARPEPKGLDESFVFIEPGDGCLELAFIGAPLLVMVMTDPLAAANRAIKIAADDVETLTEQVKVNYSLGEDQNQFPMTWTITVTKRE